VLVDGTAVAITNNTYTFENVESNKTIHVTFVEDSSGGAAKTGDAHNSILWISLLSSMLLLVGIAAYYLKKQNV
jgi:hypothetical protein